MKLYHRLLYVLLGVALAVAGGALWFLKPAEELIDYVVYCVASFAGFTGALECFGIARGKTPDGEQGGKEHDAGKGN